MISGHPNHPAGEARPRKSVVSRSAQCCFDRGSKSYFIEGSENNLWQCHPGVRSPLKQSAPWCFCCGGARLSRARPWLQELVHQRARKVTSIVCCRGRARLCGRCSKATFLRSSEDNVDSGILAALEAG